MCNLARADIRGLIIYITQSGGWRVTANRLSSTAPPFTLAGRPPALFPAWWGKGPETSEGRREAGGDVLQVRLPQAAGPAK